MARITIDADELGIALEDNSGMAEWYLDRETGEVLRVSDDSFGEEDEELSARIETEPERYVFVDPISFSIGYKVMEDFVETVADADTRHALERAFTGRKPFSAFKDELLDYPAERENWFHFKDSAFRRHAETWLEDNGIEAKLASAAEKSKTGV